MHIHRPGLLLMFGVLSVSCLSSNASRDVPRIGPLAVSPQNPRYFQNTATGETIYLTGSHTWANLVDIGPSDPPPVFDFEAYVDWMAKLNHNFTRMWTWELVSWDTKANGEGKHHTSAPQPYARTGPGTALDGKSQFDLTATGGETQFACPIKGDGVLFISRTVFPAQDWQQATPESQGLDSARLQAAVDYLRENSGPDGVNEVVIVRNGYLLWKGSNVDKVHGIWSATKSFTSTVLGLLIDDGRATLDTRARESVPALATTYPDVTLRHFTTMTSGYRAKKDEPRGSYRHGPSPTPFDPCSAPLFAPGTQYAYWDSAMNEFGLVLTHIAGEPLKDLFKRRIADPIGMDPSQWNWGDLSKIEGITVNGGSGNSNKHVFISARQIARLGHLFLNRGKWDGRQLISEKWVDMATKPQVPASLPLWPDSGADGRGAYGFNWWANGQRKWPGAPVGTYSASGFNNNDMFIIPGWNTVIVRLGLDENQRPITDTVYSTFIEKVGQAIIDRPGSASQ